MELLSAQNLSKRASKVRREDWIIAALKVLLNDGVEAVQITRLARDLEVTRGSFYWHFKGRENLLGALLDEWSARNTGLMVDVLKHARSLDQGILDLLSFWVDHSQYVHAFDEAIRDWGRRDAVVKDILSKEEDDRVEAIAAFLERYGYERTEAFVRARVIYFTQISYFATGVVEPLERRLSYLPAYFQCFTGRDIDPAAADAFAQKLWALEHGPGLGANVKESSNEPQVALIVTPTGRKK